MAKLREFTPDRGNANDGTERGRYALETSLRKYGAGRSILADKHGNIIAGNKTFEIAGEVGIDDAIVVQTDGTKLVVVQRTDLDLDSTAARELAYADNRVGQLDLNFNAEQILADLQAGVDLAQFWRQDELDELLAELGAPDVDTSPAAQEQARAMLAERFLIPPFSVLDARQGYWQARKSAWIALGIQSELGRGENASPGGSPRDAASLENGHTVRGDGRGMAMYDSAKYPTPLARKRSYDKRGGGVKMAMHNDPMQRKVKYDQG